MIASAGMHRKANGKFLKYSHLYSDEKLEMSETSTQSRICWLDLSMLYGIRELLLGVTLARRRNIFKEWARAFENERNETN